jgi:hypothetical protein
MLPYVWPDVAGNRRPDAILAEDQTVCRQVRLTARLDQPAQTDEPGTPSGVRTARSIDPEGTVGQKHQQGGFEWLNDATDQRARSRDGAGDSRLGASRNARATSGGCGEHVDNAKR